jgi:hypothetical protein
MDVLKEPILQSRRTLIALLTPFVAIGLAELVRHVPWLGVVSPEAIAEWVVLLGIAWIFGRSYRNTTNSN